MESDRLGGLNRVLALERRHSLPFSIESAENSLRKSGPGGPGRSGLRGPVKSDGIVKQVGALSRLPPAFFCPHANEPGGDSLGGIGVGGAGYA